MSCDTGYLSSPNFLIHAVHLITFISIPLHLFGAFCIIYRTPKLMSSAKWTMLNLHTCSSLLDLAFGILSTPFVLTPTISMIFYGVLGGIIPDNITCYIVVLSLGSTALAIVILFENRYNCLVPLENTIYRKESDRNIFLIVNFIWTFTFPIFLLLAAPDQTEGRDYIKQFLPCQKSFDNVFVLTANGWIPFILAFVTGLFYISQSVYFVLITLMTLNRIKTVSRSTLSLQRKFMIAIIVQKSVPTFSLIPPMLYLISSVYFQIHNQAITNCFLIMVSCHGLVATIVMLIMHKPYRMTTSQILLACKWKSVDMSSRTSTINISHISLNPAKQMEDHQT